MCSHADNVTDHQDDVKVQVFSFIAPGYNYNVAMYINQVKWARDVNYCIK